MVWFCLGEGGGKEGRNAPQGNHVYFITSTCHAGKNQLSTAGLGGDERSLIKDQLNQYQF